MRYIKLTLPFLSANSQAAARGRRGASHAQPGSAARLTSASECLTSASEQQSSSQTSCRAVTPECQKGGFYLEGRKVSHGIEPVSSKSSVLLSLGLEPKSLLRPPDGCSDLHPLHRRAPAVRRAGEVSYVQFCYVFMLLCCSPSTFIFGPSGLNDCAIAQERSDA